MSTHFPKIVERRWADHPRPYLNEYFFDARRRWDHPAAKGACSTLHGARRAAVRAVELYQCTVVRVFNRRTGQYEFTYKASTNGIIRHVGFVR